MKYPRVWKHRKTGKIVRCMPWWEIPDPILNEGQWKDLTQMKGANVKYGVLVQIGFLLENEHHCWLGVGPAAEKEFEDMGEWKKKK